MLARMFSGGSRDDRAEVHGVRRDVDRVHVLGAVLDGRLLEPEQREDAERLRRPAVDARAVRALARVADLRRPERRHRGAPEQRPSDGEAVRDAPHDAVAPEDDEPVLVGADRGACGCGGDLKRRLAAGRDRDRRRNRDRCACGRRLRLHLHLPRAAASAGVAQGDDERGAGPAGRHGEVAERERLRVGEEERRVGGREVREARALDQHRCLDRAARVSPSGAGRRHERGLHLLRRPRRMALEKQRDGAGDVRRREARAVEERVLVARELDERRRDDVAPGAEMSGLSLWSNAVRPADEKLVGTPAQVVETSACSSAVTRMRPRPPEPASAWRMRAPSRSAIMPPGTPRLNGILRRVAGAIVGENESGRSRLLGVTALQLERAAAALQPARRRRRASGRARWRRTTGG